MGAVVSEGHCRIDVSYVHTSLTKTSPWYVCVWTGDLPAEDPVHGPVHGVHAEPLPQQDAVVLSPNAMRRGHPGSMEACRSH